MLKPVKIAVSADVHVGTRPFRLVTRFMDFIRSFEEFVDKAVEFKADMVIIAGDLFNTATEVHPKARELVTAALKKLKENEIPVYAVHGNHEQIVASIYGRGTELTVLETADYLTVLDNKNVYLPGFDLELCGRGYVFENGGQQALVDNFLNVVPTTKAKRRILVIHQSIAGVSGIPQDRGLPLSMLPRGWDIIIDGHLHSHDVVSVDGTKVVLPGSTERWDIAELEEKGFYLIEWEDAEPKISFVPLKSVRPYVSVTLSCEGLSDSQIYEEVRAICRERVIEGCVFRLVLTGRPAVPVDTLEIENYIRRLKVLHPIVVDAFTRERAVITEDIKRRVTDPLSLFKEFLKKKGLSEEIAIQMSNTAKDILDSIVCGSDPEALGEQYLDKIIGRKEDVIK